MNDSCLVSSCKVPCHPMHKLPKDRKRALQWMEAICRTDLAKLDQNQLDCRRICSLHFNPEFYYKTNYKRLLNTAVPVIQFYQSKYDQNTSNTSIASLPVNVDECPSPNISIMEMSHFLTPNIETECLYSALKWDICRACLCEEPQFQPIFSSAGSSKTMLSEMMMFCTTLQVSENDSFPQQLCCGCVQQLCNAYDFKLKCERSFETLKQMQTKHFGEGIENKQSVDIKPELDIDRINDTNIITANVEAILDESIYKHNLRSSPVPSINNVATEKQKIVDEVKVRKSSTRLKKKHLNSTTLKKVVNDTEVQNKTADEENNIESQSKEIKNSNLKKHICPECGKTFESIKRLESHRASMAHKRNQPGKTIKTCLRCRKYFEDPAEYLEHVKSHHVYLCPDCGHVCRSKNGYKAHLASHSNLQPHVCDECGKKYKSQSSLQAHKRNHTGERRYSCQHCEKRFITWNSMTSHIRIHHTKERKHVCSVCSKTFTISGNLKIHMRQHTGEKPYPCSECDMSFKSHRGRKYHMVKHTGERNYPCTVCNKRFGRPNNLKQHMVTHTGERNHVCNICGRAFTQAHVLRGHMRTHPENVLVDSNSQIEIAEGNELDMTNNQVSDERSKVTIC